MYDYLIAPFVEYAFMQRALLGSLMLSLSGCPVGVFLMLRRMSLTGDAMAHAILPGAAAGFLLYGLEIIPMTVGGLVAGVIVAMGAGFVSRFTVQKEDASMAAFYLISLAVGVLIVSIRGSSVDLIALIKRWHGESRTIMVAVHDLNLVREHFPETLLLARQPVAWGSTMETLRPENLLRARHFDEAWHDNAPWCEPEGEMHGHDHTHPHDHAHDDGDSHDHRHHAGPQAS